MSMFRLTVFASAPGYFPVTAEPAVPAGQSVLPASAGSRHIPQTGKPCCTGSRRPEAGRDPDIRHQQAGDAVDAAVVMHRMPDAFATPAAVRWNSGIHSMSSFLVADVHDLTGRLRYSEVHCPPTLQSIGVHVVCQHQMLA